MMRGSLNLFVSPHYDQMTTRLSQLPVASACPAGFSDMLVTRAVCPVSSFFLAIVG